MTDVPAPGGARTAPAAPPRPRRRVRVNPVLRRELLERWRSRRAVMTLTIYLAVLGGIGYLLYRVGVAVLTAGFGQELDGAIAGPLLGRFLLEGLLFFVLLLVLFVSPAYAAAQLSGERERRTLPLLQVTLLRPSQIVLGKLGAATAWLGLLVVAVVPIGAGAFFLGGVAPGDLLRGVALVLAVAVGVAGMALGVSAVTRRTTGAVVCTYALVLALVGGSGFLAGVEYLLRARDGGLDRERPPVVLYANPLFGLADATRASRASDMFGFGFGGGLPSPLGVIAEALPAAGGSDALRMDARVELMDPTIGGFVVPEPVGGDVERERKPVWLIVAGVHLALGLIGVGVATRRLRHVEP
ncbi:MAG: ABC transporter permease, partial [Egibacteraceae bacterium]